MSNDQPVHLRPKHAGVAAELHRGPNADIADAVLDEAEAADEILTVAEFAARCEPLVRGLDWARAA